MTTSIESTAERHSLSPSTLRVRRHRERRRQRVRLYTVEVPEAAIEHATARGLLAPEHQSKAVRVIEACYAGQLSNAAMNWLISGRVISREQRGDVVAILRSISDWLERAG